jgi:hypothetical protein
MADLTAARDTPRKLSPYDYKDNLTVAVGQQIWIGALVGVDSSGNMVNASDATCVRVIGRASKSSGTPANPGAAALSGDRLEYEAGIFLFANDGTKTLALASGDRYAAAYVVDDQTVGNDNSGLFAGFVQDIDSSGAWVLVSPFNHAPA